MRSLALSLLLALLTACVAAWITAPAVQAEFQPLEWFALPGIALLVVGLMLVLAPMLEKYPGMLNLPDKASFEALADERKLPVIRQARKLIDWLALESAVLMSVIQIGLYRALQGDSLMPYIFVSLAFGFAVSPVVAMVYIGKMQTEVKRQLKRQREDNPSPSIRSDR